MHDSRSRHGTGVPAHQRLVRFLGTMLLVALVALACSSESDDPFQAGEPWELRGALRAWDGEVWIVDDQPLIVPENLGVDDQRVLGATIDASGTIDDAGRRVVESVDISEGEWPSSTLPKATIAGNIEGRDASTWLIDGNEVVVPAGARVHGPTADASVSDGDTVTIEGYRLEDERVVAVDVYLGAEAGGNEDDSSESPTVTAGAGEGTQPDQTENTDSDDNDDDRENSDKPDKPRNAEKDEKKEKEKEKDRD